ncbi:hypothetical protein ONE56_14430 [Vibrio mytili]|uniref:hypothetical protein n=1 Tax=Vibrio mytili TaxID=50718 RepID=UPI003C6FEA91
MPNQTFKNQNRINRNDSVRNKKTIINNRIKMNSFLQRIANGETGVVLEELL